MGLGIVIIWKYNPFDTPNNGVGVGFKRDGIQIDGQGR